MKRNKYTIIIAVIIVLGVIGYFSNDQKAEEKEEPKKEIEYSIYQQWTIPNGGYSKLIVIDKKYKNREDLVSLIDKIKSDTKSDRNALIWVYDDEKAASMFKNINSLSETDVKYYDDHFLASYTRNINSGYHQVEIMPEGLNGKIETIKF
ncbi:MAG: hypothetical protein WC854_10570 [Bacteroidales bacterium]